MNHEYKLAGLPGLWLWNRTDDRILYEESGTDVPFE